MVNVKKKAKPTTDFPEPPEDDLFQDDYDYLLDQAQEHFGRYEQERVERESELEVQWQEREEEEKQTEQKEQEILSKAPTAETVEKTKEEADRIKKIYAIDKFMRLATQVSYKNAIPGQIAYHVILGQSVKDVKLYTGKSYIDPREHMFWWQGPGSGKGELTNLVFGRMFEKELLVNNVTVRPDNTVVPGTSRPIVRKVDSSTSASLLNDWEKNPKTNKFILDDYGEPILVPGTLQYANFVIMSEASALFATKGSQYSKELPLVFLQSMNTLGTKDQVYARALKGYPKECPTSCDGSFIFTTRELPGVDIFDIGSGLLQRTLAYFVEVDSDLRKQMMSKVCVNTFKDDESEYVGFDAEIDEVVKDLINVGIFARRTKMKIKDPEAMSAYLMSKIEQLMDKAETLIQKTLVKHSNDFIARYVMHARKLSYHSAITRFSPVIEQVDLEYALDLINTIFDNQLNFLEEYVKLDRFSELREEKERNTILTFVKREQVVTPPELKSHLCKVLQHSPQWCYKIIRKYSTGDHALLKKDDNGNLRLM